MKKICIISTRSLSIKTFFLDNLFFLFQTGKFDITIICEFDSDLAKIVEGKIKYIPVNMKRGNVNLVQLIRFIHLFKKIFKREKFDLIQYVSSNASLYASIAGSLAHIKHRIFCEWGYTYLGYKGIKRFIYKTAEKITCKFSTITQPDSFSNLEFGIKEKLFDRKKGQVIWNGSASGVNLSRFDLNKKEKWKKEIREQFLIPDEAFVFGFVGRLMRDKGINELFSAFKKINNNNTYLLLVGPLDEDKDLDASLTSWAFNEKRIIRTGLVDNPEKFYSAMDFLVLPSYREGFGMVLLEAAALKVPSISTNILGPCDFIKDKENGFLCDAKSPTSLFEDMHNAMHLSTSEYEKDQAVVPCPVLTVAS